VTRVKAGDNAIEYLMRSSTFGCHCITRIKPVKGDEDERSRNACSSITYNGKGPFEDDLKLYDQTNSGALVQYFATRHAKQEKQNKK